jgi:predicted O-methyltransferase YrrM
MKNFLYPVLRLLKRIWLFHFIRRVWNATRVYNFRYWQIVKWGFTSREDTNFTYQHTPASLLTLAHTISVVVKSEPKVILGYIEEAQQDEELKKHIVSIIRNSEYRRYADERVEFGRRLGWYAMVRALKPKIVIETGIDKGMGSVLLCSALLRNKAEGFEGRYYGTDINPKAGLLLTGKYSSVGEVLYGDSITSLKKFTQPIDLFINDSDHSADYEYQEYQVVEPLLSDDAVILGDNSHATDRLARFSLECNRQFLFFKETPLKHWYPGAGIGISFRSKL